MLTLFTVPKAFEGHIGTIQNNAIRSWLSAFPGAQVILFGNESGIAEVASELQIDHVPNITFSELGAPLLDHVFNTADSLAKYPNLCFINSDIIFRVEQLELDSLPRPYLMIGESSDAEVTERIDFNEAGWRKNINAEQSSRGPFALDFFFYNQGLFKGMPPFRIGRARYDNWLAWKALRQGASLIDGTDALQAVHQRHDYGHLQGGRKEAYRGADAKANEKLAGLWCYLYLHSVQDARWGLSSQGLTKKPQHFRFVRQWRQRTWGRLNEVATRLRNDRVAQQ